VRRNIGLGVDLRFLLFDDAAEDVEVVAPLQR
jgi:hypothetical protein